MNDWQDSLKNFLQANPDLQPDSTSADAPAEPAPKKSAPTAKRKLNAAFERKGRGGKSVTIIYGFPETVSDDEIGRIAAKLKQRLGVGGSARGGEILIQGDRRADIAKLLPEISDFKL